MDARDLRATAADVRETLDAPALRTALATAVAGTLLLLAILVVGFLLAYGLVSLA